MKIKKYTLLFAMFFMFSPISYSAEAQIVCDSDDIFRYDDSWGDSDNIPEPCDSDEIFCDDDSWSGSDDGPEPCDSDDIFCL